METGYNPAYIIGLAGLNPGYGGTFLPTIWKVSPIRAYLTCFILLNTYPIWPGVID